MEIQAHELFTPVNIMSVGTAALAVNVVTNTAHRLLGLPPKWTAFAAALVVAYLVVGIEAAPHWYEWVLAFFNACLLFCSALGINEMGAAAQQRPGAGVAAGRTLFKSWLGPRE